MMPARESLLSRVYLHAVVVPGYVWMAILPGRDRVAAPLAVRGRAFGVVDQLLGLGPEDPQHAINTLLFLPPFFPFLSLQRLELVG